VKTYTVHVRAGAAPVVIREGFSWGALVWGPFWLAGRGAWVPAAIDLALWIALFALAHGPLLGVLWAAYAVLQGLTGRDLLRWDLERRGHVLAHVVAGPDEITAWARLLAARPDLVARAAI
jgi:hypothetical protein